MSNKPKDEIRVETMRFSNGAVLVRFNNLSCVPYSAIYEDDFEVVSCERERETGMIKHYKAMRNLK